MRAYVQFIGPIPVLERTRICGLLAAAFPALEVTEVAGAVIRLKGGTSIFCGLDGLPEGNEPFVFDGKEHPVHVPVEGLRTNAKAMVDHVYAFFRDTLKKPVQHLKVYDRQNPSVTAGNFIGTGDVPEATSAAS